MKPPVDAPTSQQSSPVTSTPNASSAFASLWPARETYGGGLLDARARRPRRPARPPCRNPARALRARAPAPARGSPRARARRAGRPGASSHAELWALSALAAPATERVAGALTATAVRSSSPLRMSRAGCRRASLARVSEGRVQSHCSHDGGAARFLPSIPCARRGRPRSPRAPRCRRRPGRAPRVHAPRRRRRGAARRPRRA